MPDIVRSEFKVRLLLNLIINRYSIYYYYIFKCFKVWPESVVCKKLQCCNAITYNSK